MELQNSARVRCGGCHHTHSLHNHPGGHPNQHKTKIICTIGPASESMETLRELAQNGMDVARLNMTHGDHQWHATVIERVREINRSGCAYQALLRAVCDWRITCMWSKCV